MKAFLFCTFQIGFKIASDSNRYRVVIPKGPKIQKKNNLDWNVQFGDFSSRPWWNLPSTWVIHMATRRPSHNTPIHMDLVPFEREPYKKSMWIGVLWAGLRVAMWITHVEGKFRHGLLEKSLINLAWNFQSRPFRTPHKKKGFGKCFAWTFQSRLKFSIPEILNFNFFPLTSARLFLPRPKTRPSHIRGTWCDIRAISEPQSSHIRNLSDSIAKCFRACFPGVYHKYRAICCKMGYRTDMSV